MGKRSVAAAARRCALVCTVAFSNALHAWSSQLAKHPIVTAVHHQNCAAAVKLINPDVRDNDAPTAFLAGRMLDEGICVQRDPELAAHFFAYAAELGERAAVLDYAAKVGFGLGTAQDYARAGELCRAAGVDSRKQLPVAGAAVKIGFTPASGALQILAIPPVGRTQPTTGSYIRQPVIDANAEINKAWRDALQMVSAPAAASGETQSAALEIDVDMTPEQGRERLPQDLQRLMPGEVHPTTTQSH